MFDETKDRLPSNSECLKSFLFADSFVASVPTCVRKLLNGIYFGSFEPKRRSHEFPRFLPGAVIVRFVMRDKPLAYAFNCPIRQEAGVIWLLYGHSEVGKCKPYNRLL